MPGGIYAAGHRAISPGGPRRASFAPDAAGPQTICVFCSRSGSTSSHASKTVIDAAADLATQAQGGVASALAGARATADKVGTRLPSIVSAGAERAAESVRMLQELPDPRLKPLAAFSLGVGAGLWMAGAPRLVTLAALSPALVVGVMIALCKQSQQGRGRRR
jgi:hypothetical protein